MVDLQWMQKYENKVLHKCTFFSKNFLHFLVHKTEKSKSLGWIHIKHFPLGIFVILGACLIRKYGFQNYAKKFLYFSASRGTVLWITCTSFLSIKECFIYQCLKSKNALNWQTIRLNSLYWAHKVPKTHYFMD